MSFLLRLFAALLALSITFTTSAYAQSPDYPPYNHPNGVMQNGFGTFLQGIRQDALAAGISADVVDRTLQQVRFDERVIERDRNQPETTQTFETYRSNTLNPKRISEGKERLHDNEDLLQRIDKDFGVPPEIIVALWAKESNFGTYTGDYEIINSMATLAYEGRRAEFFRKQLISALKILDEEQMPMTSLRGSWAGAMGQPQFMPSTYLSYAVDYDGDGKRDIWLSEADTLASMARYLASEGWVAGEGWGLPVTLIEAIPPTLIGLTIKRTLNEWGALGVRDEHGNELREGDTSASLIQPDGPEGRSFLVYDNFRALMRWNRSTYFAASVGQLADKIKEN